MSIQWGCGEEKKKKVNVKQLGKKLVQRLEMSGGALPTEWPTQAAMSMENMGCHLTTFKKANTRA